MFDDVVSFLTDAANTITLLVGLRREERGILVRATKLEARSFSGVGVSERRLR